MSFSTDDSYCDPSPIPSPQELSHLLDDPISLGKVTRRFSRKPTSSAILRYYRFVSHNVTQLEEELERCHKEREHLYNHLFDTKSFQSRIKPIVSEYRHRRALERRGYRPYGRISSPPHSPSTNNPPSTEGTLSRPLSPSPITLESCDAMLG